MRIWYLCQGTLSFSYYHCKQRIFDQVMDAAKKAGAVGGTVVHARGLGSRSSEIPWHNHTARKGSCSDLNTERAKAANYGEYNA